MSGATTPNLILFDPAFSDSDDLLVLVVELDSHLIER